MFPSIPDNIYKISIAIGLVIFGWSFYYMFDKTEERIKVRDTYVASSDSIIARMTAMSRNQETLIKNDSIYIAETLKRRAIKDLSSIESDSLQKFLSKHSHEASANMAEMDRLSSEYDRQFAKYDRYQSNYMLQLLPLVFIAFFGIAVFMGSFQQLSKIQNLEILHKQRSTNGQLIAYERCQSCACKFSSIHTYGVNEDDSFNSAFCKNCYDRGVFTEPLLTMEEVIERIKKIAGERKFQKDYWTKIVSQLDRWKKNNFN
jgi:hypothetical protein